MQWVPRKRLVANGWNPNHVAVPELRLLALSILEDGWTQPIVCRSDMVIVDGFHRWTVAAWPEIEAMTKGLVPVVFLPQKSDAEQRLATIRHNRARGTHGVTPMSAIVRELLDDFGFSPEEVCRRLGMEEEEVERLYDNSGMPARVKRELPAFNQGWVPTAKNPGDKE